MFWWREKVRHHNLYWFLLLFSSVKTWRKSQENFLKCVEQWFIIQENVFLFGIFFFICETKIFSGNIFFSYMKRNFFQKKTFFIHETEWINFSREVLGGRIFFFLCVRLKKFGFSGEKRFRVHCYVSLCMLHMQWIAEPCFKLFPCTSLFVQKTVDMFFYHVKVVRKSQGKKDRSFFHVWNTWGKKSFCFKNGKIKKFSWKKIFFFTWFLIIMKENHLVEQISL